MRIDDKLKQLPLTPEQHFFTACWFNMVHAYSLDSYRVRAMNPANSLRELHRMMGPPANPDDLARVAEELHTILLSDPVLDSPPFIRPKDELAELLAKAFGNKDHKKFQAVKHLAYSFSRELLTNIEKHYITSIFEKLDSCLITNIDDIPQAERNTHIQALTGNLLSSLLDMGGSIESLYQLYRQVLCNPKAGKNYVFAKKFGLIRKLITQTPQLFNVVFAIDNVSNIEHFPGKIGSVNFSKHSPEGEHSNSAAKKYLTPQARRLFAEVSVQTVDQRSAGAEAYEKINNVLDLVRFEYERERLHLRDEFTISATDKNMYRIFPIPKVVPNPDTSIDSDGLKDFVKSVNELTGNPDLQEEERNRVQSAFRLYRIGADTHIFENKLISWWTAIEYLVKGSKSSGGIGDAVEQTLTPVLCLHYIEKLLHSFRNALVDQKGLIEDVATKKHIQLKELNTCDLYQLFKNPAYHEQLLSASVDPFMNQKLDDFLQSLSDPKKIKDMLNVHEQRLQWHIQRLYRARCDIVHSAERIVNAALLCANLEFYLKTTLTALLQALRTAPHISGPKEFFDRQIHTHSKLIDSLSKGNDDRLLILLE